MYFTVEDHRATALRFIRLPGKLMCLHSTVFRLAADSKALVHENLFGG